MLRAAFPSACVSLVLSGVKWRAPPGRRLTERVNEKGEARGREAGIKG
jgi:hypothetical protein